MECIYCEESVVDDGIFLEGLGWYHNTPDCVQRYERYLEIKAQVMKMTYKDVEALRIKIKKVAVEIERKLGVGGTA